LFSFAFFGIDERMSALFVNRWFSIVTRMHWLVSALVLLAAGSLAAQDSGSATGISVRGIVLNSITGQGVPRALVALSGDLATLTGGDGQFSFDNVPAGQYLVSVSKPGYQGFGNTGGSRGPRVVKGAMLWSNLPPRHLQVGGEMPSVTLHLAPAAVITGVVTLSTADPADGIAVNLYRQSMQYGHPAWTTAGHATTRSDGSYRFGNLPPGSYMVSTGASLDHPEGEAASRLAVWGYPPVYYPGVTDPGSAGVITVTAGQQGEADLSVTRQAFFPVTAAVRASEGRMAANFEVLDTGGNQTGMAAHFDPREQVVRMNVPNGTWTLEGRLFGRETAAGQAQFVVAGAPVGLAISLSQIPRVPVNVQRDFTGTATTTSSGPGVNLVLTPADAFSTNGIGGGMAPVPGSDGTTWSLNVIQPGRFWVVAFPNGGAYVSSITSGGVDLASNPLIVMPGSMPSEIDVTLRDDGGSISGQVNAESGGAGSSAPGSSAASGDSPVVTVFAIPLFPTSQAMPSTTVGSDGTFNIGHVAPGSYRMLACEGTPAIDYHRPEGLSVWAGKGQTVTVDPSGTAHVTLDVEHGLEGTPTP
jgi:hypothetical protein